MTSQAIFAAVGTYVVVCTAYRVAVMVEVVAGIVSHHRDSSRNVSDSSSCSCWLSYSRLL